MGVLPMQNHEDSANATELVAYISSRGITQEQKVQRMQELTYKLNDKTTDKETKQEIFTAIQSTLLNLNSAQYATVHSNILLYMAENWQDHELWLNSLEFKKYYEYVTKNQLLDVKIISKISDDTLTKVAQTKLADFYGNVIFKAYNLARQKSNDEPASIALEMHRLLSVLYKNDLDILSKMLFIKDEKNKKNMEHPEHSVETTVIYNNKGYIDEQKMHVDYTCIEGKPLTLNNPEKTPIGYNITIPHTEQLKGVLVIVYGGGGLATHPVSAGASADGEYLLNHGVALVKLNLADLLHIKVHQQTLMSKKLHTEIIDSIKQFYDTLSQNPETLHPDLVKLKHLRKILSGSSFGGRTAIKFAETYPNSFDGFISDNGGLSFKILMQGALPIVYLPKHTEETYKKYLDPIHGINNITKDVLVLQNLDDNTVNAKVAFDWMNEALKLDNSGLMRVHTFKTGNPIPSSSLKHKKGHYSPKDKETFKHYCKVKLEFIEHGASQLPAFSEWQSYIQDKLANKFYTLGTLQEKFIAEALRIYKKSAQQAEDRPSIQDVWQKTYEPLYIAMWFVDTLKKDDNKIAAEIEKLKSNNMLTNEVIKNAMRQHMTIYLQYVRELHGYNLPIAEVKEELINSPQMIQAFREILDSVYKTNNPDYKNFILTSLYTANPELLVNFNKTLKYTTDLIEARTAFGSVLDKEKTMITKIWQQAKEKVVLQEQANYKKFITDIEILINADPPTTYIEDIYKNLLKNIHLSLNENVGKNKWSKSNHGHLYHIKQKYVELIKKYEAYYADSMRGENKFAPLNLMAAKASLALIEDLDAANVFAGRIKAELPDSKGSKPKPKN
jgi:hypothetical protein